MVAPEDNEAFEENWHIIYFAARKHENAIRHPKQKHGRVGAAAEQLGH